MAATKIEQFKSELRKSGFVAKAVISDQDFAGLVSQLDKDPDSIATPAEELRYIEGLLELPIGLIKSFKVIPKKEYHKCACGRMPTALDIIAHALRRGLHPKQIIRDAIIGFNNLFELAENGREAECIQCGRRVVIMSYWTNRYMYA